jgi:hypothetical protein
MWLDRFRSSDPHKPAVATAPLLPIRSTRFRLDLAISFVSDGRTFDGLSLNVSNSGLLARCDRLPEIWTDGQLFLEVGEHCININARVARVQENDVGFTFSIITQNDRLAVSLLINSVLDHPLTCEDLAAVD